MQTYEVFEEEFGRWAGVGNVVACNSGTAALHLAVEACGAEAWSEVIVPDFTMIACPRAVTLADLKPVFVDCWNDMLVDWRMVDDAITDRTVAIMAVHIYGRRCDMEHIHMLAKKYDLYVIEDLAEAHGVRPHSDTDASCWSFYQNKIIAGEEGGAVAFRDPDLADHAKSLRSLGFTKLHDYIHTPRGHNYRLANLLAAKILGSLRSCVFNIQRRQLCLEYLDFMCPFEWKAPPRDALWMYDFRIPGLTWDKQSEIITKLKLKGVAARHGFKPMHLQPEYSKCHYYGEGKSTIASREVIYIPFQDYTFNPFDVVKSCLT